MNSGATEAAEALELERLLAIIILPADQLVNFLLSMLLAVALGLLIAVVYRLTHRGMNYESGFLSTLTLLAPIVTLVMFFIQGDLVLSLGLVGSLSIIRFRTPIKDTRDMVFLFWSIATGLGVGTLNWTVSVFATVVLSLFMGIMFVFKYGRPLHAEYILIVSGSDGDRDAEVERVVSGRRANVQLRNHEIDGNRWELTYELRLARAYEQDVRDMVTDLKRVAGVSKVSLLTPQLSLPM
ncbi:MAG: DUF4956 domain-containing protein [Spirochaetaceae bacterium]|nr:MAG: DUF4956 domain-containing protein [Spirochaetaceae bacterium]